MSEIVLGTAQLNTESIYGIANRRPVFSRSDALTFLQDVWDEGLRHFDTATAYGNSESLLGEFLVGVKEGAAKVVSKLELGEDSPCLDFPERVKNSQRRFPDGSLDRVLFHKFSDLQRIDARLEEEIHLLADEGKGLDFGVSVYSPEEASELLACEWITCMQLPCNVFDQRWKRERFERADRGGLKIDIRSVFLQGLVLMDLSEVPDGIPGAESALRQLIDFCDRNQMSRGTFSVAWCKFVFPQSRLVFGAETIEQVREILDWVRNAKLIDSNLCRKWATEFSLPDPDLLTPYTWNC